MFTFKTQQHGLGMKRILKTPYFLEFPRCFNESVYKLYLSVICSYKKNSNMHLFRGLYSGLLPLFYDISKFTGMLFSNSSSHGFNFSNFWNLEGKKRANFWSLFASASAIFTGHHVDS